LLDRSRQQHPAGDDDRRRVTRAREAAEALFLPKRLVAEPVVVESPPPSDSSPGRKPRVLGISAQPIPAEAAKPATHPTSRMTLEIAKSDIARVRTWMKYGMTVAQAAAVYGVSVDEIERALRRG
jgi:hypothetical protein